MLSVVRGLERDFIISGEYAGLHILMTDKRGRTEEELIAQARKVGVRVYGISQYYISEPSGHPSTLIVGYASLREEEIRKGGQLLLEAWNHEAV